MRFDEFDLKPELRVVLRGAGYETCTPIQQMAIPDALAGHDIIAVAKTGTGKTLAFLVPIFQSLEPAGELQALIVCPTRELALQVGTEAEKIGGALGAKVAVLYGGTSMGGQKQQLLAGLDLVVGTPGRLLDFISSAYLPTRRIRWLVLDEADRMLDMGFIDDVDRIIRRVPMSRQTMLFSATVPAEIAALAQRYMLYPKEFRVDKETRVPEGIEQLFYACARERKVDMLRAILKQEEPHKALVFTATRDATSEIARRLRADGHEVYPLSSNLRQADRERVLAAFREGRARVVVATDVAARGIDIDDISHVVNVDLPMEPEDYVHRVGRTGRVERLGRAISLVEPRDGPNVRAIGALIGRTFDVKPYAGFEAPALDSGERDSRGRRGRSGRGRDSDRASRSGGGGHAAGGRGGSGRGSGGGHKSGGHADGSPGETGHGVSGEHPSVGQGGSGHSGGGRSGKGHGAGGERKSGGHGGRAHDAGGEHGSGGHGGGRGGARSGTQDGAHHESRGSGAGERAGQSSGDGSGQAGGRGRGRRRRRSGGSGGGASGGGGRSGEGR